ncbi:CBO0543 family protein [Paenibacillus filicis]|uniref:CBO0543 family protein n=1 Tax=Paenibacillus filicis TaxID=669464 RepID=A0ABU9DF95_9BACL
MTIHLLLVGLTLICFFRSRCWILSARYHTTAIYMILGSLLYLILTAGYLLWSFVPDTPMQRLTCELLYSLFIFPLTTLMFLNGYPEEKGLIAQFAHLLKWVGLYGGTELVLMWTNRIQYGHGWSWYSSVVFDLMMFPMLRLHSRRPLVAYVCSVPIIIGLMLVFRVPFAEVSSRVLPDMALPPN